MKSGVVTILSALSLLLCVCSLAIWIPSGSRLYSANVWRESGEGDLFGRIPAEACEVIVFKGGVHGFAGRPYPPLPNARFRYSTKARDLRLNRLFYWSYATMAQELRFGGFGFRCHLRCIHVSVPLWAVAMVTVVLPALWVRDRYRRWHRRRHGLCVRCGYDLRASAGRCPECGTEASGGGAAVAAVLACLFCGCWAAMAAAQERPEVEQRPWYAGKRFFWNGALDVMDYLELAERLPPEQAEALRRLGRFTLVPLDLKERREGPAVTFILAGGDDVDRYVQFPGLKHLDFYRVSLEHNDLSRLAASAVVSLQLNWKPADDAAIADLLGRAGSLRNLRHLGLVAEREDRTPGFAEQAKAGQRHMPAGQASGDARTLLALRQRTPAVESIELAGSLVGDEWLAALRRVKGLRGLRLHGTSITSMGVAHIVAMGDLRRLTLEHHADLSADWIKLLGRSRQLQELHLAGSSVTDDVLRAVVEHTRVESLVLDSHAITGDGFRQLSRMPTLRTLVVASVEGRTTDELRRWQTAAPERRRLFLRPDAYFSGWISDPDLVWRLTYVVDPKHFP